MTNPKDGGKYALALYVQGVAIETAGNVNTLRGVAVQAGASGHYGRLRVGLASMVTALRQAADDMVRADAELRRMMDASDKETVP